MEWEQELYNQDDEIERVHKQHVFVGQSVKGLKLQNSCKQHLKG